ncbi:PASTA domain-containing protein [Actinocorallia sp. A-T 12471]|uniref:PASTA domain-containing protein n=1 Tax=Actinocorallia sp. A-T 12471 TaxID=3089813 RepID=UPI0029CE0937|nr:PASTA domain-containing protein [Actinocorallia sp. A-T 12471]MDX6739950.1 PASTA domain-containing protein [Actinocorallia sp. A-T 12471]
MLWRIAVPVAAVAVVAGVAVAALGDDSDDLALVPERPTAATASSSVTPSTTPHVARPSPVSAPTSPSATPTSTAPKPQQSTPAAPPSQPHPQPPGTQPPATQEPPPPPTARPVPDVVGMSLDEAAAALAQAGFGYARVCVRGRDERVLYQQPTGGQEWTPGSEVALYVAGRRCRDDRDDDRRPLAHNAR